MDQKIKETIINEIDVNDVCLFMKGTPDAPQCGFSMAVTNMLKILDVNFKGINVLEDIDEALEIAMKFKEACKKNKISYL